jgi:uncharacterized protein
MPIKPSESEEEHFTRVEAERKKKYAKEHARKLAEQQRQELKERHWMRCPKCGMELQTIKYQDIEVDRCFTCNGTWLDQGELEKVAASEKSGALSALLRIFK